MLKKNLHGNKKTWNSDIWNSDIWNPNHFRWKNSLQLDFAKSIDTTWDDKFLAGNEMINKYYRLLNREYIQLDEEARSNLDTQVLYIREGSNRYILIFQTYNLKKNSRRK